MRFIAAIYLGIILINLLLWARSTESDSLDFTASVFLLWVLYAATILSLLAYITRRMILPTTLWRLLFALYVGTRFSELWTRGMPLSGNLEADLNRIGLYLFMAVPPAVTLFYLGFIFTVKKNRSSKPSPDLSAQFYSDMLP